MGLSFEVYEAAHGKPGPTATPVDDIECTGAVLLYAVEVVLVYAVGISSPL